MKNRFFNYGAMLLVGALAMTACSSEEDVAQQSSKQTWKVSGIATLDDASEQTRAASLGGSTGQVLFTNWVDGEKIAVIQNNSKLGDLTVTAHTNNTAIADIEGTVSGTFSVGDELTYYTKYNSDNSDAVMTWDGQTGSIQSLSTNYNYQKADVEVYQINADNDAIKMTGASFHRVGSVVHFRFKDANDNFIRPDKLTITAANGHLVKSIAADGTKTYGDIVVTTEANNITTNAGAEYPGEKPYDLYVALYNDGTSATSYTFTVESDDMTYTGPTDALNSQLADGDYRHWYRILEIDAASAPTVTMPSTMTILQGTTKSPTPYAYVTKYVFDEAFYNQLREYEMSDEQARQIATRRQDVDITDRYTFSYSSSNPSVAQVNSKTGEVRGCTPGTATITVTSPEPYEYNGSIEVTILAKAVPATSENYVDLGLTSGTLWAKWNVGAASETDLGVLFTWGEVDEYDKNVCDWSTYQWCNGVTDTFTKYVKSDNASEYGYNGFYDNLSTLKPEDDAATQIWGAGWRMPTKTEMQELRNECDWNWENGTGNVLNTNGVKGYKVSKKGDSSVYIFLPAAGYNSGTSRSAIGEYLQYWTSSLDENYPRRGWHLEGYNGVEDKLTVTKQYSYRCYGYSIRAVHDPIN